MAARTPLSRRDFLKLLKANFLASMMPASLMQASLMPADLLRLDLGPHRWPALDVSSLPSRVKAILERVPLASIGAQGYLVYQNSSDPLPHPAPVAQTLWNKEHRRVWDRLDSRFPWGIVLHWYGDKDHFDRSIPGYLRGFDGLRKIDDILIRTSAHFLVGDADPVGVPVSTPVPNRHGVNAPFGILQTQLPDRDGTPFVASHLRPIDFQALKDNSQYFVSALSHLDRLDPSNHLLLQDLFLGPRIDPNMRTIAIEIAGHNFDTPAYAPSEQKIANVVALVWALMKRYGIPASHILGHHEITLGKPDPGKKFLALVRHLIGVKALVERDGEMKRLVFGQFLDPAGDPELAVGKYFQFIRDYQVLISPPRSVYEWESWSNYWLVERALKKDDPRRTMGQLTRPLDGKLQNRYNFLVPSNHEGVDLIPDAAASQATREAILVAEGECIFTGKSTGGCPGKMAMFRHCQPDGARVITVFNHLDEMANIQAGKWYPPGTQLGTVEYHQQYRFLHFAVAYGATWETDLRTNPDIPRNAGPTWIRQRYFDPVEYLHFYANDQTEIKKNRYESE